MPDIPELPKPPGLKMDPLPHQQRVSRKLKETPGQIAFHGLGTGKGFSAINAAEDQKAPLVAVVPASLRNNMRKEIEASGFSRPFHVLSYEQAHKKRDDPDFQQLTSKSVVAYDEAHRTGAEGSARSQLPDAIPAKKKLFLTGTPIRNHPSEVAPMVNALRAGSLPKTRREFSKHFIKSREVPVGFWGKLKGAKPGKVETPVNLHWFEDAVKGKVDHHESVDRTEFPSFSESVVEVPMTRRQQATHDFTLSKYPVLAYKIRHGIPLNKKEQRNFKAFMIGPRQASNHPGAFNRSATDEDAAKITRMADEVMQRHHSDPHYRGVSYSSFLQSGVRPMSRELTKRGIPHHVFTGEQSEEERKTIISDYNSGKVPHLLISGAGAEGLDLKGTKLMQITEPHWNEKLIDQVRGRAIRYKSHAHLPDDHRHVEVQRFHSTPRMGWADKALGRPRSKRRSTDEYIYDIATQKSRLNQPFLDVMKGIPASQVKTSESLPAPLEHVYTSACKFAEDLFEAHLFARVEKLSVERVVAALAEPMPPVR